MKDRMTLSSPAATRGWEIEHVIAGNVRRTGDNLGVLAGI